MHDAAFRETGRSKRGRYQAIQAVMDRIPPTRTMQTTGHIEAVQITYDPSKMSYSKLLDVFWRQINPTDTGGQFCDRGPQYRSAIFYQNNEQKRLAEKSKEALEKSGRFHKPIVTELIKASVHFTRPRSTTRITIKRTRSGTNSTGTIAAATSIWRRSGERMP